MRANSAASILLLVSASALPVWAQTTPASSVPAAPAASQPAAPVAPGALPVPPGAASTGTLAFSVVIVDDLTPKPVPLTDFQIMQEPGDHVVQTPRTDAQGQITLSLPPGDYDLASVRPTSFKGKAYSWKKVFTVEPDKTVTVSLTDSDATTSSAPARQISDEAKIYESLKNAVVTVECDSGHGSGFIVDKSGLVITNQHVTAGTQWVALHFGAGVRIHAQVVEQDKDADVAILRFNPQAVSSFGVMPLADTTHGPVTVEGEKVLAIGSPLRQEQLLTTGIVSRVEKDAIISDVNINHGNSGGPLLNLAGEVIGITTFLDAQEPNGPGLSGIVAIQKAVPVLAKARVDAPSLPLPSTELLPDISPTPIPDASLADAALVEKKPYELSAPKNFQAIMFTPFTIASLSAADEREMAKGKNSRMAKRGSNGVKGNYEMPANPFWEQFAVDANDAVVPIIIQPVLREKAGSASRKFFGALAGAMSGAYVPPARTSLEFRDDFYDMALYRGGQLVLPVRQNRVPVKRLYEGRLVTVNDSAFEGVYLYDPSVFEPSQPLVLKMRRESNLSKWDELKIDTKAQQKVWEEFAPYRQETGTNSDQIIGATPETIGDVAAAPAMLSNSARASRSPITAAVAAPAPPAVAAASPVSPSRLPVIKSYPQKARIELTDGNSYFGSVTAFDGTAYTLTTSTATMTFNAADVKTLELQP